MVTLVALSAHPDTGAIGRDRNLLGRGGGQQHDLKRSGAGVPVDGPGLKSGGGNFYSLLSRPAACENAKPPRSSVTTVAEEAHY